MSRPTISALLRPLIIFDAVSIGAILAIHAGTGDRIPAAIVAIEVLGVAAVGIATGFYWWRIVSRDLDAQTAPPAADLDTLRRENAENLKLIQDDLHGLGEAILKRLSHKVETKPESEHYEAIAGTVSDLAVNVAAAASDMAEAKSAVFEMQAQLDQLTDALRSAGHTVDHPRHIIDDDSVPADLPQADLSRAIAPASPGAAVSRIIAAAAPAKPEPDLPDEAEFTPGDEDDIPEAATDTATDDSEELATDDTDDWLTAGISEPEENEPAGQPELLSLDETAPRKPRRPAKGQTAILAHMMIGIGNKPYLRGIGPGLSTERGVPMEYVDVGLWQWISPNPSAHVVVSIWKNDEHPAAGDIIELTPGEILEVHPRFDTAG